MMVYKAGRNKQLNSSATAEDCGNERRGLRSKASLACWRFPSSLSCATLWHAHLPFRQPTVGSSCVLCPFPTPHLWDSSIGTHHEASTHTHSGWPIQWCMRRKGPEAKMLLHLPSPSSTSAWTRSSCYAERAWSPFPLTPAPVRETCSTPTQTEKTHFQETTSCNLGRPVTSRIKGNIFPALATRLINTAEYHSQQNAG